MLDAKIQILKQSNKAKQQSKCLTQTCYRGGRPPEPDLTTTNSPLRNVEYHVVLSFRRRGHEGRKLLTKSFKFEIDEAVRRYTTISHDETSKNHPRKLNVVESTEKRSKKV